MDRSGRYRELDTIRHRPYLDKVCREILNRAARQIYDDAPDWVEDPTDPKVSDLLEQLQRRQNDGAETPRTESESVGNKPVRYDSGLLIELLENDLTADEAIYWMLWRYSGLDPTEIYHAKRGVKSSGIGAIEDNALRNTKAKIQSAANKLGEEFVESRSNYMYQTDPEGESD